MVGIMEADHAQCYIPSTNLPLHPLDIITIALFFQPLLELTTKSVCGIRMWSLNQMEYWEGTWLQLYRSSL